MLTTRLERLDGQQDDASFSSASVRTRQFLEASGDILGAQSRIYELIRSLGKQYNSDGSAYLPELGLQGSVDCIRYTPHGVEFIPGGREIGLPPPGMVNVLVTAVSLCGTDRGFLKMMEAGTLPPSVAEAPVAGHEMGGVVIGVGVGVDHCGLGDLVNPDSHVPCGIGGHDDLDACVESSHGCDGIVSVRGQLLVDGSRGPVPAGYFSRVAQVDARSIVRCIPEEIAAEIVSPSIFESLGNSWEVALAIEEIGLTSGDQKTMLIVSGLGATGYPLTACANRRGLRVVGVDPSPIQRQLATESQTCEALYATTPEAADYVIPRVENEGVNNVVVAVMSGHPQALESAMKLLTSSGFGNKRKVLIVFGLYDDTNAAMPFLPADSGITQRSFVFDRKSHTTEQGVQIVGVCGRSRQTWFDMMHDFDPRNPGGSELIRAINRGVQLLPGPDPFHTLFATLSRGETGVREALAMGGSKVKLAANFFHH